MLLLFLGTYEAAFLTNPEVIRSIPNRSHVGGMACLGDEVFAVFFYGTDVEVFNVDTLNLQRRIPVAGIRNPHDLVLLSEKNLLFIADWNGKRMFRVELKGNVTSWSLIGSPYCLSVSAKSNVLATIYSPSKLFEFTQEGQLIREISLQQNLTNPMHAILLTSGQFLLSRENSSQHGLFMVGDDGRAIHAYVDQSGSAAGPITKPYHMVVDKHGSFIVVDSEKSRIVILSPSLTYVRDLIPPSRGLRFPFKLYLDETRGLLYVGEHVPAGARILVFKVR